MAWQAVITNIAQDGTSARVFYRIEPVAPTQGQPAERSLVFDASASRAAVRAAIRADLTPFNDAERQAVSLQPLINEVIS